MAKFKLFFMKRLRVVAVWALLCCLLTACIQEELPNSEADILTCNVTEDILLANPVIQNTSVQIRVQKGSDLTALAPEFTLSPRATITPASGTVRDFTTPQTYTVTSESGEWKKTYLVSFIDSDLVSMYHFENVRMASGNKYYIFVEKDEQGKETLEWASGNAGFALTGAGKTPADFPTLQSGSGYWGKCLQLVTRSTGAFGTTMGMPIAAGNLFMGAFHVADALKNPLTATKFGVPFDRVPTFLTGYYKYKAGPEYSEKGKVVEGKKDICNIYAIFYETPEGPDGKPILLDGTNMLTHPNLYSVAQITNAKESDQWIRFELPFITREGKTLDIAKLKASKYNIAIVFSSSIEGDQFSGAVGSTLLIDEVELLFNRVN